MKVSCIMSAAAAFVLCVGVTTSVAAEPQKGDDRRVVTNTETCTAVVNINGYVVFLKRTDTQKLYQYRSSEDIYWRTDKIEYQVGNFPSEARERTVITRDKRVRRDGSGADPTAQAVVKRRDGTVIDRDRCSTSF